jgi:hypothetical protein
MRLEVLEDAAKLLEKANADLEPDLLSAESARTMLKSYARLERLVSFGVPLWRRR